MITCTTDAQIARAELARPEHAEHAAIIRHIQPGPVAHRWTTVHESAADALAELDRIAAGDGNYFRDRMANIEIGTAFGLLRKYVT